MVGTKAGGLKAAATNKAKYGSDYYVRNGRKGGQNGHTGGFAANRELARIAGAKGGRMSRRGKGKKTIYTSPQENPDGNPRVMVVEPKSEKPRGFWSRILRGDK